MKRLGTLGRAVGATLAAGAILAGSLAIGGLVFASGNGTTSTGAAGAASQDVITAQRRPLSGAVHADMTWTLRDGSTARSSADGGLITSVANGSITIRRSDGKSVTGMVGGGV